MDSQDSTITYKRILDRAKCDAMERMPEMPKTPESELYADSARGIYIPQHFAESVSRDMCDAPEAHLDVLLQGPDHEDYWDVWTDVLDNTTLKDSNGQEWTLRQDGDLWLVPKDAHETWESFIAELEDLGAYDIAHECSEWDWVIYYARALELCQAVPTSVLHDAESEWQDMFGKCDGLYETAVQLAAIIVTQAIAEAVEEAREELLELAHSELDKLELAE